MILGMFIFLLFVGSLTIVNSIVFFKVFLETFGDKVFSIYTFLCGLGIIILSTLGYLGVMK